jgi:Ca-activated chloride channel family protein
MNVTATDSSRRYVTDLDRQDFQIFEDGRPQQVTFFRRSSLPLALALLIDTSASMEPNLGVAQEAAVGFIRALGPEDIASVIDFDTRVEVRQDFTTDRRALEHAIRKTAAGGSTALYNAVYIALKGLTKTIGDERLEERRRRAIVILSDGEDTSSLLGFDEVLDLAVRSDTAIYAIGLLGSEVSAFVKRPNDAQFVLRRPVGADWRPCVLCPDAKELSGVYGKIRAELANQYFLAYESTNPRRDGQFRRILGSRKPCQCRRSGTTRLLRAQSVGSQRRSRTRSAAADRMNTATRAVTSATHALPPRRDGTLAATGGQG